MVYRIWHRGTEESTQRVHASQDPAREGLQGPDQFGRLYPRCVDEACPCDDLRPRSDSGDPPGFRGSGILRVLTLAREAAHACTFRDYHFETRKTKSALHSLRIPDSLKLTRFARLPAQETVIWDSLLRPPPRFPVPGSSGRCALVPYRNDSCAAEPVYVGTGQRWHVCRSGFRVRTASPTKVRQGSETGSRG